MKLFVHPLTKFNGEMPDGASCLDIGALDFTQYHRVKNTHPSIKHSGVDYMDPTEDIPKGYVFKKADLNTDAIPFLDDSFDFIVASHIIEHLDNPIAFFGECIRVLKPGGKFYIEAPSEKSVSIQGMSFDFDGFYSLSLYDDPTHSRRPWTPNSFWRLARYFSAEPIVADYVKSKLALLVSPIVIPYARIMRKGYLLQKIIWLSKGWAAYAIISKTKAGAPAFQYSIPTKEQRLK